MRQNPSIGHRILHRGPYLVLGPQVAHPYTITFSYAILFASGRCDDLKFAMSRQRPEKIFNNLVGHCSTQLVLFCRRLEIKWETFFYIETTQQINRRFVLKTFSSPQKFRNPIVAKHIGLEQ